MPRVPAKTHPPRLFINVELNEGAKNYLRDLGDDVGCSPPYIIRLCIEKALPEIEKVLRSGEVPPDNLNRNGRHKKQKKYRPLWKPEPVMPILGMLDGQVVPGISPEFVNAGPQEVPEHPQEPSLSDSQPDVDDSSFQSPAQEPESLPEPDPSPGPQEPRARRRRRG